MATHLPQSALHLTLQMLYGVFLQCGPVFELSGQLNISFHVEICNLVQHEILHHSSIETEG